MSSQSETIICNVPDDLIKIITGSNVLSELVKYLWPNLTLCTKIINNNPRINKKFKEFNNFQEKFNNIAFQKFLRLSQGRAQNIIKFELLIENFVFENAKSDLREILFNNIEVTEKHRIYLEKDEHLTDLWVKLYPELKKVVFKTLRKVNDEQAIDYYSGKLRKILLSSGIKNKVILSLRLSAQNRLDGIIIDQKGEVLDFITCYPFYETHLAVIELAKVIVKHNVNFVVISNLAGWRQVDKFIVKITEFYPDIHFEKIIVSDAGAEGYSEKHYLEHHMQHCRYTLDKFLLKAFFIARRTMNPLNELKNISPKLITLDSFQSQVNQIQLVEKFQKVIVESLEKAQTQYTEQPKVQQKTYKSSGHSRHDEKRIRQKKAVFNTAMRDALQKLNYGEKS